MKKQKYNNKAVYVGADRFDSKRELARYRELQAMEKAGTIQNLERQVAFPLIDKSEYGRTIKYVADFVYWQDGYKVVEDVKSYITAKNPVYRLKKRLLAERYGIVLHEVF